MSEPDQRHVFISYVREDTGVVDKLCSLLEAATIPYWRDRKDLAPGDAWKAKIKEAIRSGSLVFLACFSDNSRAKQKSYMNEELTLAVDEYRSMPPGRTWLIPVRLDDGNLPPWDLGAGRDLDDLNRVDLFGEFYTAEAVALTTTIHRVMGDRRMSPASALAAVEQAAATDRAVVLRRLTKDMLLEPARRIELDDLVSQQVQRVATTLKSPQQATGPLGSTLDEVYAEAARRAAALWKQTEPFCASLQVAARWGAPDGLGPWVGGLRAFVTAAQRVESGEQLLLAQRHLPGLVSIATATLSAVAARRWDNLRALVVEPSVRDIYQERNIRLFEATSPASPFGDSDWVSNTLARAEIQQKDFADALADFPDNKAGKYRTAVSEWLNRAFRQVIWPHLSS